MKAIMPMTKNRGPEYKADMLQLSGRPSTIPAKGQPPKGAMIDGPFGGKKPA